MEDTNEEELDFDADEPQDGEGADDSEKIDWKATAMRYKRQRDALRTPKKDDPEGEKKQPRKGDDPAAEGLERINLRIDGHSPEAIDFIMKLGGRKALDNEHVAAAVRSIDEQKRAESATVQSDTAKSDIERKYSPEEIAAMSPEELYKVLPKARK